jgi:pre-mRNA-splicing helicase BRR2
VLAELAIFQQLNLSNSNRCVYVLPYAEQVLNQLNHWRSYLLPIIPNLTINHLTGDLTRDLQVLGSNNVILTIPKYFDQISRRWKQRRQVNSLSLIIFDNLELLNQGELGATMEIIMARARFMQHSLRSAAGEGKNAAIRLVGLSDSIANSSSIAEWLGISLKLSSSPSLPNFYNFHPASRPLPLELRFQMFDQIQYYTRQLAHIKPAFNCIKQLAERKSTIVWASTVSMVKQTARDLLVLLQAHNTALRSEKNDNILSFLNMNDAGDELQSLLKPIEKNSLLTQLLSSGIGFLHSAMTELERSLVINLYERGVVLVVVIEVALCYSITLCSYLVIICGTDFFNSNNDSITQYPIQLINNMIAKANRQLIDSKSVAVIFTSSNYKQFYKKFLLQPLSVESNLDYNTNSNSNNSNNTILHDTIVAEMISKRVSNVQDCLDYLTWTLFYRRLTDNPNYYNLLSIQHNEISDYLSELVENVLEEIKQSQLIEYENNEDEEQSVRNIQVTNYGQIAAYYYLKYTSMEILVKSINKSFKLKQILQLISNATEFDSLLSLHCNPNNSNSNAQSLIKFLDKMKKHLPIEITADNLTLPTRINILIQVYLTRYNFSKQQQLQQQLISNDLKTIIPLTIQLLQALIDIISSNAWLTPALLAMKFSQMLVQGIYYDLNNNNALSTGYLLLQLPHFNQTHAKHCTDRNFFSIHDILAVEDEQRLKLFDELHLNNKQINQIAQFCNDYPDILIQSNLFNEEKIEWRVNEAVEITLTMTRDPEEEEEAEKNSPAANATILSNTYPATKSEGYWLVLAHPQRSELLALKHVVLVKKQQTVILPYNPTDNCVGKQSLLLYWISDSYMGIDQHFNLNVNILPSQQQQQ